MKSVFVAHYDRRCPGAPVAQHLVSIDEPDGAAGPESIV